MGDRASHRRALLLNLVGYASGAGVRPWVRDRADRTALLFTVSKKEFSIAAIVLVSSGLPSEVAVPTVVTAVVQMITSPIGCAMAFERSQPNARGPGTGERQRHIDNR